MVRYVPISEYDVLDAVGLAELVAQGDVSPEELLDEAVQRIERTHAQLNAVVYRDYARARCKIGEGLPAGPLRGVPLLVKETMPIADMPLTFGSVLLRDRIASETHAFAQRR
jgi:Asp-tRNA(Asn)/Glu-tRNA(Gln) amidotransferase A subunit family amidase